MENPKIKIFKQLGVDLIKRGQWFLNKAFGIKTVTITKDELASAVMEVTGLPRNKIALHDEQYYLTDWKVWKDIFKYDWTNHKKYLTDKYDCDNFAESFKSRAAEIYGLNSAGRLSVQLVNPNTGKHIGYHRANVLIALEEGNIVVYAYDPMEKMLDKWCLINKGQPIIIKNWQYLPKFIAFN